jgi:hypothetical protein
MTEPKFDRGDLVHAIYYDPVTNHNWDVEGVITHRELYQGVGDPTYVIKTEAGMILNLVKEKFIKPLNIGA